MRKAFSLLPAGVWDIVREIIRHLLRRPVVGICAVCRSPDGRVLLIRRADTGGWCIPGGTLEWGEVLSTAIRREIEEETGATVRRIGRVTGIYSRPNRDPRFHAVTVCVLADVEANASGPKNLLEIREAKFFDVPEIPYPLSMNVSDLVRDALANQEVVLE